MEHPFTSDEKLIMDKLVEAHKIFINQDIQHLSDSKDWTDAIHTLQRILCMRALRREYPEYFAINESLKK